MTQRSGKPHFIWFGAGLAIQDRLMSGFLQEYPRSYISLVEARETAANKLKERFSRFDNIKVYNSTISYEEKEVDFYFLNLVEHSGIEEPTRLTDLYPGVKVLKVERVRAASVIKFICDLNLIKEQSNQIFIDFQGQSHILLRSLIKSEKIDFFKTLHVSCSVNEMYKNGAVLEEVEETLKQKGYEVAHKDFADPDFPLITFKKSTFWEKMCWLEEKLSNALSDSDEFLKSNELLMRQQEKSDRDIKDLIKKLTSSEELLSKKDLEIKKLTDKVVSFQGELLKTQKELNCSQSLKIKSYDSEMNAQVLQGINNRLLNEIENKEKLLNVSSEHIKALQSQLSLIKGEESNILTMEENILRALEGKDQQALSLTQALGQHITLTMRNYVSSLENFIEIKSSQKNKEVAFRFDAWSISKDLALTLIEKVKSNNYDLIIEFGAGVSTHVLADAIFGVDSESVQRHFLKDNKGVGESYSEEALVDRLGFPKRIISFEHDKGHLKEIKKKIELSGCSGYVEFVHAPLVRVEQEFGGCLFYSCIDKLKVLSKFYEGRCARILVLVDGVLVPGEQNIRYPTLPLLMQYLAEHQIDIFLDDYHRETEQKVGEMWRKFLQERQLKYKEEILFSDHKALFVSINS